MQKITIEVDPEGQTEISVKGVKGASCTEITAELEKALGVDGVRELTEEFRETPLKNKERNRA